MKIIQICAAYKPAYVYGGPTMSVSKLSEELVKAGQDVTVLTTTANGKSELDVSIGKETLVDGVKVYYFKRLTKDHTHFSPSLFWFLHRTLKNAKRQTPNVPLIIHIHAWWNLVSIFSCLVAKLHGVKVILSPRGMLTNYSLTNRNSKLKDIIHFFLGKKLLKYCHIHATSTRELKDVQQTCEVNGISIVPNFVAFPDLPIIVDERVKNQGVNEKSRPYKLLFFSRIEAKKGLELLFEALAKSTFPWILSIGGSGDHNYIQNLRLLANRLAINDKITWLGHIGNENKFEIISQHDLMVLTSYNENFANVVIESLFVGTPVLLSEEVGLANYVVENNLGWVVSLNSEEIAETLEFSFSKTEKRKQIRENAPEVIKKEFNEKTLAKQYINFYHNEFI